MKIEDKLISSHEALSEGITVIILKTLYENKIIDKDDDVEPWLKRVSHDVEMWLRAEYVEDAD